MPPIRRVEVYDRWGNPLVQHHRKFVPEYGGWYEWSVQIVAQVPAKARSGDEVYVHRRGLAIFRDGILILV